MTLGTILLIIACVCFGINAYPGTSKLNLDAAGKAFVVAALIVGGYVFT